MALTKATVDYYKNLCDVENNYSWKNTSISVPMSTMQDFMGEIENLNEQLKYRNTVLIDFLTVFLKYTSNGNRCGVCGMALNKGHTSECKVLKIQKFVEKLKAGGVE